MNPVSSCSLVIDGRALVGRRTGIGVHTAEIAQRLACEPPPLIATHRPIEDMSGIERLRFRVDRMSPGVLWQQSRLARVAELENADLVWGPHGTLPVMLRRPAIITIHDLTSLTMPLKHRMKTIASFNLLIGRSIARARHIACVSRATADEVMRGFGVEAARISIVPNGVDEFFSPADDEPSPQLPFGVEPQEYILYVGTLEPRKGLHDLVSAWERLASPRPRLVLCGDLGWGNVELLRRIEHHRERHDIIVSGYLSRESLRALMRQALLFVYPSHYEGFGLPPLEAMACGASVITTSGGAIPEVVGDGAVVVPPRNSDALHAELERLRRNPAARRALSVRGRERAAGFTWQRAAAAMDEAISVALR